MKPKPQSRVLVCDEARITQGKVHQLFVNESGLQVLDEVSSTNECITRALELKPDIVLINVGSPNQDGAEAVRQLVAAAPGIKVLAYSSDSGWETADRMLGAGALGYAVEGSDQHELVRATRTVLSGGHYLGLVLLEPFHRQE